MLSDISFWQKMVSACLGLLVTLFVVTPFDVIRVRIQQQELLGGGNCVEFGAKPRAMPLAPFWVGIDQYCHACDCQRITLTWQGMTCIARTEGLATLWRGLSLTLVMSVPSNIIYFTGYEFIRDHSPINDHPLNPLVCGLLARTISATLIAPLELIKTRLQLIPSDRQATHVLRNLLRETRAEVGTQGISTLFRGLQITLWRDVPFSGIYWLGYEWFKRKIASMLDSRKNSHLFLNAFVSGLLLGLIAAVMTHPFDVGKTRLQIERTHDQPQMFRFLWKIYVNEGPRALFSGLPPRVMKIAPACAMMISSYEIGKKLFAN